MFVTRRKKKAFKTEICRGKETEEKKQKHTFKSLIQAFSIWQGVDPDRWTSQRPLCWITYQTDINTIEAWTANWFTPRLTAPFFNTEYISSYRVYILNRWRRLVVIPSSTVSNYRLCPVQIISDTWFGHCFLSMIKTHVSWAAADRWLMATASQTVYLPFDWFSWNSRELSRNLFGLFAHLATSQKKWGNHIFPVLPHHGDAWLTDNEHKQ